MKTKANARECLFSGIFRFWLIYFHAAGADLLRRAGWFEEAAVAYAVTLELAQNKVEKAFLRRRLEEMEGKARDT